MADVPVGAGNDREPRSASSALKWIGVAFVACFALLLLLAIASDVWAKWHG